MNQELEDYLKQAIQAELDAEGITIPIYTGTSGAIPDNEDHGILALADEVNHQVGPLYIAEIQLAVKSPVYLKERAEHKAGVAAVKKVAGNPPAPSGFGITWFISAGSYISGVATTQNDDAWLTTVSARLGVVEQAAI